MSHAKAIDDLIQYARYHRDTRNIATHVLGIPLIVLAVGLLLSLLRLDLGGFTLNGGWLAWALATLWYLRRGLPALTLATSAAVALLVALAQPLAALPWPQGLAWGLGVFVVGWVLQFIGHFWEGRKPAFFDDLRGLLIGPMFVVAEGLFACGWGAQVHAQVQQAAGPLRRGGAAAAA